MSDGQLPEPYISSENVRAALQTLIYSTSRTATTNPLEALVLVEERLTDPDRPKASQPRAYVVRELLIDIITSRLTEQRQIFGFSAPQERATHDEALREIAQDVRNRTDELSGWCFLYYRYVRDDLGITLDRLTDLFHVHERTGRRYHDYGIACLTDHLMEIEQAARQRQRLRRLYSALPASGPLHVVDRDNELEQLNQLAENHAPAHALITGPPGIGKSTLLQVFLCKRIRKGAYDQIIWIEDPPSIEHVLQRITEQVVPENASINFREYFQLYRVAIVLDEIDGLQSDTGQLDALIRYLGPAEIYLTARRFTPLAEIAQHIELTELDQQHADECITVASEALSKDERAAIWETVGGNPLLLKLLAQNYAVGIDDPTLSLERIYTRVFTALDAGAQHAWSAFALLPVGYVELDLPLTLWSRTIRQPDIDTLRIHHLLEFDHEQPHCGQLSSSARQFIDKHLDFMPEITGIFRTLLSELDAHIDHEPEVALETAEHILFTHEHYLDQARRSRWIHALWNSGLAVGHSSRWCTILGQHILHEGRDDPGLHIAYGVCLRRLSQWEQAQGVFERTISQTGRSGAFIDQAKALIELAALYRYRGDYKQTDQLLSRAEQTIARQSDAEVFQALRIEQAQSAIDQGDGLTAQRYLNELHDSSGRVLALHSEAALLLGDYVRCRSLAEESFNALRFNQTASARVLTIVGRSFEAQRDFASAQDYFAHALTLLEPSNDIFGLARAQLNLGALLIRLEAYDQAKDLLTRAENTQMALGDRTALMATQHNLRLLRNHIPH